MFTTQRLEAGVLLRKFGRDLSAIEFGGSTPVYTHINVNNLDGQFNCSYLKCLEFSQIVFTTRRGNKKKIVVN